MEVNDQSENYDTLEIVLFDVNDLGDLPNWLDELYLVSRILHELLHIKYPNYNEDQIADSEAHLIGSIMKYARELT